MDSRAVLFAIAVVIPLVVGLSFMLGSDGMAERHHRHHDTYQIAAMLKLALMFAIIFMGALGVLLAWLCVVGVFGVDPSIVLAFFDAFLTVSFVYWLLLNRYKVVTYDTYMEVTPFFGFKTRVVYADISSMEWTPSIIMPSGRNIRVYVGHRRCALLWGGLDLDQILIRIDRFDALDDLSTWR